MQNHVPPSLFLLVFLTAMGWNTTHAQQQRIGAASMQGDSAASAWSTIGDDAESFVRNTGHIFSAPARFGAREWMLTGAGVGTVGLAMLLDEPVRDFLRQHQSASTSNALRIGNYYGHVATPAALSGALYLGGLLSGDEYLRETGLMIAEATAFAGIVTTAVKLLSGRSRPYMDEGAFRYRGMQTHNDRLSFPSGHCTVAFAVSSVLAERIDHPIATVILYLLAGSTVLQRMYDDQHWLSDAIAGSLLGYLFGRAVIARHPENSGGLNGSSSLQWEGGSAQGSLIGFRFVF